jgi:hypothetical protein
MADFEPGEYAIQVKITDNIAQVPLVSVEKFSVR